MNKWQNKYLLVLLLVLLLYLLHVGFPEYIATGPELLDNPKFSQKLEPWIYRGEASGLVLADGAVRLKNDTFDQLVELRQSVEWPAATPYLQLSGRLRSEDVGKGERSWHLARLVLARYDERRRWLNLPHYVASLDGTRSWRHYVQVFEYTPAARYIEVALQLPHAIGVVAARDLSLRAAVKNSLYSWSQMAGLGLGGLIIFLLMKPPLTSRQFVRQRSGLFFSALLILCGTLMPLNVKKGVVEQTGRLVDMVQILPATSNMNTSTPLMESFQFDKGFHFTGFLLLGFFLALLSTPGSALFDGFCFGGTTELMQFFVPGRTPLLTDVWIDAAGILVGIILFSAVKRQAHLNRT